MNESELVIRKLENKDIEEFYKLVNILDNETEFRAYEPGERVKDYRLFEIEIIEKINNKYIIVVCEYDNILIGYIEGAIGLFNRNRHLIHFNIALKLGYTGLKIGEKLINKLELEAKKKGN